MVRSARAGRSQAEEGVKKGPWTPEEDQKLIAYIQEHGHGNWRALPKKCGLQRCGKSCRLRWTNYLRPDIKRGLFTNSEKQKIIQLHNLVGNRWAFIASQLPNRTDNEIKNYWNTVLKKTAMNVTANLANAPLTRGQLPRSSKRSSSSSCSSHLAQWESVRVQAETRLSGAVAPTKFLSRPLSSCNIDKNAGTPIPANPGFASNTASNYTTTLHPIPTSASTPTSRPPSHSTHSSPKSTLGVTSAPSISCKNSNLNARTRSPARLYNTSSITNLNHSTHTHYPDPAHTDHSPLCDTSSLISLDYANTISIINPSTLPSTGKTLLNITSSSQASAKSAITLGPNGQLTWKTQELCFKDPPSLAVPSKKNANESHGDNNARYNSNCIDVDHLHHRSLTNARELGHKTSPLHEATCSSMDLNSMISLSSSYSWHELLFEVENGCSSEAVSCMNGGCCHQPHSPKWSYPQEHKVIPSLINYKLRNANFGCKAHASPMQDSMPVLENSLISLHEEIDMTHMDVEILTSLMED